MRRTINWLMRSDRSSGDLSLTESPPDKLLDLLALLTAMGLALAFRLPGLTVFLTADEPRSWFGRSIIFLDSLLRGDFANTGPGGQVSYIENVSLSPAPGVTTMWTGAIGIILEYWRQGRPGPLPEFLATTLPFDPLNPTMLVTLRLPGVLVAAVVVGLTFWWSRPLLGRWAALLLAALLALDPFYLALSRILGHDALVAGFMWLSLLALLRALVGTSSWGAASTGPAAGFTLRPPGFVLISGACAGLAFLSKYPALFIGAFAGLAMLLVYLGRAWTTTGSRGLSRAVAAWLVHMLAWSAAAGVIFILLWPAMWLNPLGPLTVIINDALRASGSPHQKGSFFLGQPVPDPGAIFYPLVAVLRTTPVLMLGLLLSLWLLFRPKFSYSPNSSVHIAQPISSNEKPAKGKEAVSALYLTLLILLAYILLYTLLVTYGGKKQDRYLLPVFPAMAMAATLGYLYLMDHNKRPWLQWFLPLTLVLIQAIMVYPYHPYYFSYYNPFAGGGAVAARTIQVGWGEGLNEAAAYLNTRSGVETAKATAWYSTTFEPYFRGQAIYKIEDEKISRSAKPGVAADYVVFYINQVQRRLPSDGTLAYFQQGDPLHTVLVNGQPYAWIYQAPGVSHIINGEARLVGQGELLGYDLTNEAGQPVTNAYPESVLFLSLYWEWQGKAEDEPIGVSLVDDNGLTRGWGNHIETVAPLPYAEWQEGMIVRENFALVIFADTPPGRYHLAAWIDRPATGETVGIFPLADEVSLPVIPRPSEQP